MYQASVAVSAAGDAVYVTPGNAPNDESLDNVYHYNMNTNYWSVLPQPDHCCGVLHMVDDRLTIFGGYDTVSNEILNKVVTYTNSTNRWYSYFPNMLHKRHKPGVTSYQNCVIVMGGMSSPDTIKIHDTIEIMDHDRLQWKEAFINLLVPMYAMTPTIAGDNIAIVGYDQTSGRSNDYYQIAAQELIASLNQSSSTGIVSIQRKLKELPPATCWDTATIPNSNPPVIVGDCNTNGIVTSDITIYNETKNSWWKVGSLTSPRHSVGVALLNDNNIIVIGGCTDGSDVDTASASSLTTVEIGKIVPNQ